MITTRRMLRTAILLAVGALVLSSSACVVHTGNGYRHGRRATVVRSWSFHHCPPPPPVFVHRRHCHW